MTDRPRVLIVDDERSIRSFVGQALLPDCDVLEAADGAEGLAVFERERPDVVFADLQMPNMQGLDFIERALAIDADTTTVVMTAYADKKNLTRVIQLGALDILEKPFTLDQVYNALRRAVEHRRLLVDRRRAERAMARVERFARRSNAALSLPELIEFVKQEICDALAVRLFSLFLYDASAQRLRLVASNHVPMRTGEEVAVAELAGPMRDAVLSQAAVVVADYQRAAYADPSDDRRRRYIAEGSATVPLVVRGRLVGILNLNDKQLPPDTFDEVEIGFLTLLGEHLASAIAVRLESEQRAYAFEQLERTQRELIQTEKLAAMAKLVAGVAHEIKNPLQSMYFAAVNLGDELGRYRSLGTDTAGAEPFIATLVRDIERLRDRIHDFTMFARPEGSARSLCRPADTIRRVIHRSAAGADAVGSQLRFTVDDDIEVKADAAALEEAIVNLVGNALDAAPGGNVDVVLRRESDRAVITVRDDGLGIPPDLASHIFDLFFTSKAKGGGVGLSQVHVFCDTHGGRVTFESKPGATLFRMELPVE